MYKDPSRCQIKKRSVTLEGHRTSVSVEDPFWEILTEAAETRNIPLSRLIVEIDTQRQCNLSSALRLFALEWILSK